MSDTFTFTIAVDGLLLAKAAVSIGIVVALSLIAEHAGPRVAGLLIGLPLGAGMVIVFTSIEQGPDFAVAAAKHMVPGFMTTCVFLYLYAAVAAIRKEGGIKGVILPSLAANAGYAASAWVASQFKVGLLVSIPLIIVALFATSKLMAYLPDRPIANRVRFGWGVLLFRAGMASTIIVIITGIASNIGPQWTGILTAFPITLFPLILVLHITYSGEEIAAVLKHVPGGLGGVTTFCVAVTLGFPALGPVWGSVAAFATALLYPVVFSWVARQLRKTP